MPVLYHGSPEIVERPILGLGNPHNDYGLGFYCTMEINVAREWASASDSNGYVNCYDFEDEGLRILDLESEEYHILNWLAVLLQNRVFRADGQLATQAKSYLFETFLVDVEQFDVVRGYRADDSYFSFASAFLNGTISIEQLSQAMRLGSLGTQIVPRSERAFERLKFVEALPVDSTTWYPRKTQRDSEARSSFRSMKARPFSIDEHYVIDMLREEWGDDAACLR